LPQGAAREYSDAQQTGKFCSSCLLAQRTFLAIPVQRPQRRHTHNLCRVHKKNPAFAGSAAGRRTQPIAPCMPHIHISHTLLLSTAQAHEPVRAGLVYIQRAFCAALARVQHSECELHRMHSIISGDLSCSQLLAACSAPWGWPLLWQGVLRVWEFFLGASFDTACRYGGLRFARPGGGGRHF
jgi:hypothetical protein